MLLIAGRRGDIKLKEAGTCSLQGLTYLGPFEFLYKFAARSLQGRPGSRQDVVAISIKKRSLNIESHFAPVAAQGAWHGSQTFVSFLPHEE